MNRDFKGIWIPKEIWLHSKISIQAKALWAEIDSLYCEESGGCYASDEYLSQFLGLGIRRIQEILKELRKNKLLVTTTKDNRNRIMKALPLKTASSKSSNFCKESEPSTLSRAFLGIWIPREIWLHPEISLQAKTLWSEIKSLSCEQRKGCYASDQYLMNFLGLKTSQLHVFLKELKDHNLVISINQDRRKRLLQAIDVEYVETHHRKLITQDSGSHLRRIPEVTYAGFRKSYI